VGLLFLLLQTVASRLAATEWTPFLNLIQTLTYMGLIVGAALGYSGFSRGTVRWLTFFYMLLLLPLQWTWVIDQNASLEEQFQSVLGRLLYSMSAFVARKPVEDPLFFVAVMSIAFWMISAWAGFALTRNQNYLGAVLPGAIGLLIIQNYDNSSASRLWFIAFFTFIALLLLGRLQFLQNRTSWRERRIFLSPDTTFDITSSMAIAAGLIIFVAWSVPASVSSLNSAVEKWNQLTKPWKEFSQEMENAVSAIESQNGVRRGEFFIGSNLALGRGFPNSDDVMFIARVPDLPADRQPPRFYWRGRIYDNFSTNGWTTTGTSREEFSPFAEQRPSLFPGERDMARFSFQTGNTRISLLYGPSQPVWFSRSGTRLTSLTDAEDKEVISWNASPELLPGETYQADALIVNPNRQQLREAGTDYPEWVRRKYLQLPEKFSPRIVELAKEITASVPDTPYDKAVALTDYLRKNLKYSATIPQAPRNKDPLEWVLFEYKQAYCVYYATSEILMLRSLGIPARMAVGFTQGNQLTVEEGFGQQERAISNAYEVLRNNAHAWPEVYFPGIGWVEFEPTASVSPLDRPLAPQEQENTNNIGPRNDLLTEDSQGSASQESLEETSTTAVQPNQTRRYLLFLLPFLAAGAALTIFLNRRYTLSVRFPIFLRATIERTGAEAPVWVIRWGTWEKLTPIEKAFESINFGLRQLDKPIPVHTTPIERAEKLTRILPEKADQIKILLDEHQTSLYTSRVGDVTHARQAAFDLRRQVIVERIRYLLFGKPSQ